MWRFNHLSFGETIFLKLKSFTALAMALDAQKPL